MAHLALYRTYRPQDFTEVVGQKHIVQTIKNQILNDLLAHAYVLTGPRGTGKTSIARIVAKAINCTDLQAGNPCSACESCLAVANGNHPDVFELDGASNNGVDEIRDIRERVKYSASLSAYKVYIIDEVHMLSTGAFNALLKTLEEPPAHVIFLLATTEIHKVPETILSRVQRFDLQQIPTGDMAQLITRILGELGVNYEDGAPDLIASLAAGGLRDALSMLDQAIAYSTDGLRLADIHELNGSVSAAALVQILEGVVVGDFAGVAESARALLASGKLPARLIDGLLSLLRDVLKVQKIGGEDVTGLAGKMRATQVLAYIRKLNALAHDLKIATDAALILEIGLIELGLDEDAPAQVTTENTPAKAQPLPDYSAQFERLTKQINTLQNEITRLKAQQKEAMTAPPAPTPIALENEVPIYVQGELMQEELMPEIPEKPTEPNTPPTDEPLLIETVLASATKQDKEALQNKVAAANPFADLAIKEFVMYLKDAEIAAASPTGCILVYDYETTVQKLLTDQARAKVHQLLSDMLEKPYEFLAMPKDFWQAQRGKFVTASKQGEKPVLEQYPQRTEAKLTSTMVTETAEEPFYQEVVDLFGDLVEVHE
ncbi:MAG: DNA polymerase III subunit gamma/tau [Turicibacter sp.]|nr:DNA polymerase III subunit gamma/tau [Turicibacter sp.]